jgi:hypothetical protein
LGISQGSIMKKCPKCRAQHFDGVDLCDCGYQFSTGETSARSSKPSNVKSKGLFAGIGVLILALVAGSYFGKMVGSGAAAVRNATDVAPIGARPLDSQLAQLAGEINSTLPRMVDSATRLDKVVAGPGGTITYLYTMPGQAAANFDLSKAAEATKVIKAHACGSLPLLDLLKRGARATYVYLGSDGKDIVRIGVRLIDCTVGAGA